MKLVEAIQIRSLNKHDPPDMAAAFQNIGWTKPEAQFRRYLDEEAAGSCTCLIATTDGQFAGYVTVNWRPAYPDLLD